MKLKARNFWATQKASHHGVKMQGIATLIKKYLGQGRVMQIATVDGGNPWICTVYFVADDDQNLYWLSLPDRRHSQEIARHSRVAIAIPVKVEQPVIGLQAEGTASVVTDTRRIADVMRLYAGRYNSGKDFLDNFIAGKNQHVLYQFTPESISLFDEVTFGDGKRRDWQLRQGEK